MAECGQTRICISHRDPYDAGMDTNCKALCSRDISHGLGCRRGTSGSRRQHFWGQTVAPRTPTHEANASSEAPGLRLQVKPAARDTQVGVEQAAYQHPLDQPPQDLPQRTLANRACDQASATALGPKAVWQMLTSPRFTIGPVQWGSTARSHRLEYKPYQMRP